MSECNGRRLGKRGRKGSEEGAGGMGWRMGGGGL